MLPSRAPVSRSSTLFDTFAAAARAATRSIAAFGSKLCSGDRATAEDACEPLVASSRFFNLRDFIGDDIGAARESLGRDFGGSTTRRQSSSPSFMNGCSANSFKLGRSAGSGLNARRMSALVDSDTAGSSGISYSFARMRLYVSLTSLV